MCELHRATRIANSFNFEVKRITTMFLSAVALEVLSGILFFNTIGLVKTESDFIVTLVETDLGR